MPLSNTIQSAKMFQDITSIPMNAQDCQVETRMLKSKQQILSELTQNTAEASSAPSVEGTGEVAARILYLKMTVGIEILPLQRQTVCEEILKPTQIYLFLVREAVYCLPCCHCTMPTRWEQPVVRALQGV